MGPKTISDELVQQKDGDDAWQCRCDVWGEDMLNPIKYDLLIEPCLFVEAVDNAHGGVGTSLRAIVPLGIPAARM
jgi:hypothetical protein